MLGYGKPLEIREFDIPDVQPNGILLKVEMAGICGTDVHLCRGTFGTKVLLPNVPGHEGVGRILKLGEGRTHDAVGEPLHIGDRILWSHAFCGSCYWCDIVRKPTLCQKAILYGVRRFEDQPYLRGSFAEYEYLVPHTKVLKILRSYPTRRWLALAAPSGQWYPALKG